MSFISNSVYVIRGLSRAFCILISTLIAPTLSFSLENRDVDDFIDNYTDRAADKQLQRERKIQKISQKYALMFFYFGNQEASRTAANDVKALESKYNWLTYSISVDGILIEGFKNNRINNGIFEEFEAHNPYRGFNGPVLFLFNPNDQAIIHAATGSSSFQTVEDHIYAFFYPFD